MIPWWWAVAAFYGGMLTMGVLATAGGRRRDPVQADDVSGSFGSDDEASFRVLRVVRDDELSESAELSTHLHLMH